MDNLFQHYLQYTEYEILLTTQFTDRKKDSFFGVYSRIESNKK